MNLLITGALQNAEAVFPELIRSGHAVQFMQHEQDTLPCDAAWVEGVVCNGLFQWHPIETFIHLRYIQLTSAGLDRVPLEYIRAHGITLHSARGVYSIPMAEFALCGVLQLYKQAAFFRENQKTRRWQKHRGLLELNGKTVCIVGCGSVGTECAKRFRAFGCRVIGVDLSSWQDARYDEILSLAGLDKALSIADVVVLTLPLTADTRGLINGQRIEKMNPRCVLVNLGRGPLVDEAALTAALRQGRIGGAVLDVFEKEPLPEDSPLWEMENVLISPHNCFVGDGNANRLIASMLSSLSAFEEDLK